MFQHSRAEKRAFRMTLEMAAQPDMVRAHQKDEHYREQFLESAQELARRIVGPRTALLHERELQLASDALYYLTTVACGQQTPGEEYCDIVQVTGSKKSAPGISRRTAVALLQACGPYVAEQLRSRQSAGGVLDEEDEASVEDSRSGSLGQQCLAALQVALPWLLRGHLAFFYLYGWYYQWSHRLSGVRYLFVGKIFEQRPKYSLLGVFMILQMLVTATSQALTYMARERHMDASALLGLGAVHRSGCGLPHKAVFVQEGQELPEVSEADKKARSKSGRYKCPLCLSPRNVPTATPCGHVFCWDCIASWTNQKPECPLCRAQCEGSDLVCVHYADF